VVVVVDDAVVAVDDVDNEDHFLEIPTELW